MTATIHVPAEIPPGGARIMFIAEAPGKDEIEADPPAPLVGAAGHMFNALLRLAGIDRTECGVTNVFDEKLPYNDVKHWCGTTADARKWRKGGSEDTAEGYSLDPIERGKWLRPEYRWHLTHLADEIRLCRPNVIVPLGGTALWALTGHSGIQARRGYLAEAAFLSPGKKLLPTLHPAALTYDDKAWPLVVLDLKRAVQEARSPDIVYEDRECVLNPTLDDLRLFANDVAFEEAPMLGIDIETKPKLRWITSIAFSTPERAICVPFYNAKALNGSYWPTLDEELQAWKWVRMMCECTLPKVMQNGVYDWRWLFDMGIFVRNYRHDPRLAHHALQPEMRKSLGVLGSLFTRLPSWKWLGKSEGVKRDE